MLRRCCALALALASFGLGGCGDETEKEGGLGAAESEALYVDLDGLKYQVQISRQLNPKDSADADYFTGIDAAESTLEEGSVWFGVFLRVENESKEAIASARTLSVEDTQGNEFEPVESENTFAYRPETIPGGGYLPDPERLQAYAGSQGSLLLFKIPYTSLDNRPLELTIRNPSDSRKAARVDLDV